MDSTRGAPAPGRKLVFNEAALDDTVRDAASVVLLRDGPGAIEIFMLRRGGSSTVMNDAYVFPGGKVDPDDGLAPSLERFGRRADAAKALAESAIDPALATALFVAACRETLEETGVHLRADQLWPLSRWITPKVPAMMRRRFDTRFFVAPLPADAEPVHDGQEADASEWFSARAALQAYRDGRITLAPPQIMTLVQVGLHADVASLQRSLAAHRPALVEPFGFKDERSGARAIAYPGDPMHPVRARAMPGPTRLIWRDRGFEPFDGFDAFFLQG